MPYNLTNLSNANGMYDMLTYINGFHGNIFGIMLIITLFFILLLRLHGKGFEEGLLTASFITFLFSLILSFIDFVPLLYPIIFVTILIFTGLYTYMKDK